MLDKKVYKNISFFILFFEVSIFDNKNRIRLIQNYKYNGCLFKCRFLED